MYKVHGEMRNTTIPIYTHIVNMYICNIVSLVVQIYNSRMYICMHSFIHTGISVINNVNSRQYGTDLKRSRNTYYGEDAFYEGYPQSPG